MKRQKFELTGDAAKVKRDRVQRRDFNDLMCGKPGPSSSRASRPAYHHISGARHRRYAAGFEGFKGFVRAVGFF